MKRDEVVHWLGIIKNVLLDMGLVQAAYEAEQVECRVMQPHFTPAHCKEYALYIIPKGKRGRVTLVLHRPEEARAKAVIVMLLNALED